MRTSMRQRRRAAAHKAAIQASWWLKCEAKWNYDNLDNPRAYMGDDGWLVYY